MVRGVRDLIDGVIERSLVGLRWFCKSGQFPDKLQRRSANLVIRRWW